METMTMMMMTTGGVSSKKWSRKIT